MDLFEGCRPSEEEQGSIVHNISEVKGSAEKSKAHIGETIAAP